MDKICIIGISKIKHMALVSIYENLFKENNIKFDLINIEGKQEYVKTNADKHFRYHGHPNKILRYLGLLLFFTKVTYKGGFYNELSHL